MITIAQEFYDLNNTKINFDKAELICNRNPANPDLPLPSAPLPFTFTLSSKQFCITPLSPRASFRFLGVWFTFAFSAAFVKQQCKTEYSLFAKKLSNKRLTIDQIRYLHNAVLLPRVEYRLKATMLSEKDCKDIMSPMKKLFKNASHLTISIPDAFLHSSSALNFFDLFARILTNHASALKAHLITNNGTLNDIMDIRLANLQTSLYLPFSPLVLKQEEFSVFHFTKSFRHDLIFRILFFSSKLGITFARPLQVSRSVDDPPLVMLFRDKPNLLAKSLHIIHKYNVKRLSHCFTQDGLSMMTYQELTRSRSNAAPTALSSRWYSHVTLQVTESNSHRLKSEYLTSTATAPQRSAYSLFPIPNKQK